MPWPVRPDGRRQSVVSGFESMLPPPSIAARAPVASKKALFARLAAMGAMASGLPEGEVAEALWLRERLGPTGFGGGTAIPHARLPTLTRFHMGVVTLAEPIDYDAVDGAPVDLAILLLSPTDAGAEHLKLLARISRLLRDGTQMARLRGATSSAALHSLLVPPERDAA